MPNINEIFNEISFITHQGNDAQNIVRRKYLSELQKIRDRNVVCYYSAWLSKPESNVAHITDEDKNGFMSCFHGLDCKKGLDLILHTPGGEVAATESIIDYIRQKFGDNVEVFVPQISMSGGTMMALCGNVIHMGKQSNLGPIDPQFGRIPAQAAIDEFERAYKEINEAETPEESRAKEVVWYPILSKYQIGFLSDCRNAIEWSEKIATEALQKGMMKGKTEDEIKRTVQSLLSREQHLNHGRHIHRGDLKDWGVTVKDLEDNQDLQDAVLSVHHAYMATMMTTGAVKIIENHNGNALVKNLPFPT